MRILAKDDESSSVADNQCSIVLKKVFWEMAMSHGPMDDLQQTPDQAHSEMGFESVRHELAPSLLELVDDAVARLLRDEASSAAEPGRDRSAYSQAFPVGEALGRSFRQRCCGEGPFGLANLIERMTEASAPPASTERAIRRGLFSGFCWELERGLAPRQSVPDSADGQSS